MYEHTASAIVPAPVERVYELFSFFHHYPDIMAHVRRVTYYDDQHTQWTVNFGGGETFDAVNEDWHTNARIGWRATRDAKNSGEVLLEALSPGSTRLFMRLRYRTPAVVERALQRDLDRFVRAVAAANRAGEDLAWPAIVAHLEPRVETGIIGARDAIMG